MRESTRPPVWSKEAKHIRAEAVKKTKRWPKCEHGELLGYCAECGKKAVITCQRCNGQGEIDMDEAGMVSCPVCDGACVIDYEMVAEYARQIDYYVGECAKKNAEILRLNEAASLGGRT